MKRTKKEMRTLYPVGANARQRNVKRKKNSEREYFSS